MNFIYLFNSYNKHIYRKTHCRTPLNFGKIFIPFYSKIGEGGWTKGRKMAIFQIIRGGTTMGFTVFAILFL